MSAPKPKPKQIYVRNHVRSLPQPSPKKIKTTAEITAAYLDRYLEIGLERAMRQFGYRRAS